MHLRSQRGRELSKTPALAKEDNYYLETAEWRRKGENRSQKIVVLSGGPEGL